MMLRAFTSDELNDLATIFEGAGRAAVELLRILMMRKTMKKDEGMDIADQLYQYSRNTPFTFTADLSDLSFFWSRNKLPLERLDDLNPDIKEAVKKNLDVYEKMNLIIYNPDEDVYRLTDYGKRYVKGPEFVEMVFRKDAETDQKISGAIQKEAGNRQTEDNPKVNYEDNITSDEEAEAAAEKFRCSAEKDAAKEFAVREGAENTAKEAAKEAVEDATKKAAEKAAEVASASTGVGIAIAAAEKVGQEVIHLIQNESNSLKLTKGA